MTALLTFAWIGGLLASAAWWIGRPIFMRPKPRHVARLVEQRVDGLHNGLTNSLLLAEAEDLRDSPWLGAIFNEVLGSTRRSPLAGAVRFVELRRLGGICAGATALVLAIVLILPAPFAHGFRQMLSPGAFVPKTGDARIIEVQPGDATLIAGQPLEVAVAVEAKPDDAAELIVGDTNPTRLPMALQSTGSPMRFAYRVEHVDESMRYRIEVGGTQSRWFSVRVVKQISLQQLQLRVTPPGYTKQPARLIMIKPDEVEKIPVTVLQGSQVEVSALVDAPVSGAMVKLGSTSPLNAKVSQEGLRVEGSFQVMEETPMSILLTSGTGQIVAALPAQCW